MKSRIAIWRFVHIDDMAALVSFIVGPDCRFATGFTFDVSGGRTVY
jgi:NAD(P)-dependent dehydrogenase (short-subunit alcohol dehydrogenase family)